MKENFNKLTQIFLKRWKRCSQSLHQCRGVNLNGTATAKFLKEKKLNLVILIPNLNLSKKIITNKLPYI